MSTVTIPQVNPNDEITAASVNQGPNAIAAVVNGNIDDTNVSTISGTKISAGTLPGNASVASGNLETFRQESGVYYIVSGLVWSTLSGLNASMTSGIVYLSTGVRTTVAAIASKTFTASQDTYVYVSNTGVIGYIAVANNAAFPLTLPSGARFLVKVVTSGSAVTSITPVNIHGKTYYSAYNTSVQSNPSGTPISFSFTTNPQGSMNITTTGKDLAVDIGAVGYQASGTGSWGFRLNGVDYVTHQVSITASYMLTGSIIIPASSLPAGNYVFEFRGAGSGTDNIVILPFSTAYLKAYELSK